MKRLLLIAALALTACDWVEYAFVNSIPVTSSDGAGDFHVYLAVDGLSFATVAASGAFEDWSRAKFVTMFPGTSDASWTRILRTGKLPGYELEYYDPEKDELIHGGFFGGARHVLPSVSESLSFESKYLSAFDYHANGYGHSIEAYSSVWVSAGESLDNLFFTMEGRLATSSVFTAYLLESDLLGHLGSPEECTHYAQLLEQRIADFRAAHPERRIHFTLLSDHGMDFTEIPRERFVDLREELPKVGVEPLERLADATADVFAVPVVHTRVTYVALHTKKELTEEVAARSSRLESVDFAIARLAEPDHYGIWRNGELAEAFAYLADASAYRLSDGRIVSDEELFAANPEYPDWYYRIRTALEPIGVEYPAEVIVSLKPGWNSIGFVLPGAVDLFGPGYHGAMTAAASTGVLISDERELPDIVRGDAFLDLFPRARMHLEEDLGLELIAADRDAARPLR